MIFFDISFTWPTPHKNSEFAFALNWGELELPKKLNNQTSIKDEKVQFFHHLPSSLWRNVLIKHTLGVMSQTHIKGNFKSSIGFEL